jgi:methylthioribulose-1-phosphate dehydratase
MQFSDAAQQIVSAGRWLDARGWAPATSGCHKGRLEASDVMTIDYDGRPIDPRRPSAETPLHCVMYRLAPTLGAVVHTHSVLGTIWGLGPDRASTVDLEGYELLKAFPGIATHETRVAVPIFDNTQDMAVLAHSVAERWQRGSCPGYLIRGHGLYTWGTTMEEALRSVETFEFLLSCELEKRRLRP